MKKINTNKFGIYGWVINYPDKKSKSKKKNLFRIVLRESRSLGWRIAYLIVRDKAIDKLEQHPESFESFEPVRGKSLLYLSNSKNAAEIKCFVLDRPVILKKGIWHGVVTLDREAEIKITENAKVKSVYWPLDFKLIR